MAHSLSSIKKFTRQHYDDYYNCQVARDKIKIILMGKTDRWINHRPEFFKKIPSIKIPAHLRVLENQIPNYIYDILSYHKLEQKSQVYDAFRRNSIMIQMRDGTKPQEIKLTKFLSRFLPDSQVTKIWNSCVFDLPEIVMTPTWRFKDFLRMSDSKHFTSCHAPGREFPFAPTILAANPNYFLYVQRDSAGHFVRRCLCRLVVLGTHVGIYFNEKIYQQHRMTILPYLDGLPFLALTRYDDSVLPDKYDNVGLYITKYLFSGHEIKSPDYDDDSIGSRFNAYNNDRPPLFIYRKDFVLNKCCEILIDNDSGKDFIISKNDYSNDPFDRPARRSSRSQFRIPNAN